jgi:hypothetical protein
MIKWLQNNPLGVGLASFCGAMLLLAVLLAVLWALPPSASGIDPDDPEAIAGLEIPMLRDAGQLDDYEEIIVRPLFNETRQPIIETEEEGDMEEEQLVDEVDAPDVELAGVIITPSLRMATLKEKGQEGSLVAFVGRPLEGDYGSWQITRIEPREVTLTSGEGKELQLKLQVHNAKIAAPPKNTQPTGESDEESGSGEDGDAVADDDTQPLSRAEEIRQRIAERREELRRAAESEQAETEVSYQQAIQNMIGKKRRDNSDNDREQQ